MFVKRLQQLQRRFVAVNMRNRSLRLTRASQAGALDLWRLAQVRPGAWAALVGALGGPPGKPVTLVGTLAPAGEESALAVDLQKLSQAARDDLMETGARDLAVGWPLLEGRTPDGTWLRAPLLLYPATLQIGTQGGVGVWQLALEEAPDLNQGLTQALRRLAHTRLSLEDVLARDEDKRLAVDDGSWRDLHMALWELGLPLEAEEVDALPALEPLAPRAVEEREALPVGRYRLQHCAVLGRFPRSGSSVVQDYDELLRQEPEGGGPLTAGLAAEILAVDEEARWSEEAPLEDQEGDPGARDAEAWRWQVMPSDSSQDAVFRFLGGERGRGLVVQGPPGTGKSQLIANLVGAAVAQGQRVLLVCQKRAALDVVAARLSQAGLREPVAVVHDTQRDRGEVCDSVAQTIERVKQSGDPQSGEPDEVARALRAHEAATARLGARLEASQRAFALLTQEGRRPPLVALQERALRDPGRPLPDLGRFEVAQAEAEALRPRLGALATQAGALAAPHPLSRRWRWEDASDEDLRQMQESLRQLQRKVGEMARRPGHLSPRQAQGLEEVWSDAEALLRLLDGEDREALEEFLLFWVWTGGEAEHGEWAQVMARLREAKRSLRYTPHELVTAPRAALEGWIAQMVELKEVSRRWYRLALPRFWRLRKVPAEILGRCRSLERAPGALVDPQALCEAALPWQALIEALPADNPVLDFGFQGDPAEIEEAIEALRAQHQRARALHRLYGALSVHGGPYAQRPRLSPEGEPADDPFLGAALGDWRQARLLAEVQGALRALAPRWEAGLTEGLAEEIAEGRFEPALAWLEEVLGAWGEAARAAALDRTMRDDPEWVRYFLQMWRGEGRAEEEAQWALERGWIAAALGGQAAQVVEAPLVEEAQLEALRGALSERRAVAGQGVLAGFHARLGAAMRDAASGRALRKLAAEARKQRYRLTLRQLVEQYWDKGLSVVRPAWFCSPDSVAALFPLREGLFDLVIFDEASQCPVEAAVPTLARARRAIIAGDDQQMPPSHFFQVSAEELDGEEEESAVLASHSLLALARVAFTDTTLRWHYRSRHEALVAFSNAAFYGGRLITAPQREEGLRAEVEGFHWDQVEGLWEEQQNAAEAAVVVDRIAALWGTVGPEGAPPSVGVVTFNRRQAELIEELLRERAARDGALEARLLADRRRPLMEQLFVRNLENVQGDERDIIIFSIGYGPREPGGRVYARFGPLGQEGGEKRLNVAITRARLGVHVVASFDPEGLQVEGSKHAGPRLLKAWLRYAKASARGASVEGLLEEARALGGGAGVTGWHREERAVRVGRALREEVAEALEARGLRVLRGLGLGSQRIDLAVGLPGERDWRLGVDCSEFLQTPDALARDVYAPLFWARLGWRVTRVTPSMWSERRGEVVRQIERAVQAQGLSAQAPSLK